EQPGAAKGRLVHHRACREALQLSQVDDRVAKPVGRGKPELGQAPLQRHLTALESLEVHVSRPRLLALATAAGRLAQPRSLPAADPLLAVPRVSRGVQLVQTGHCLTSLSYD